MERIKNASWKTTAAGLIIGGVAFAKYMGYIDADMAAGILAALTALGFIASKDAKK